MRLRGYIANDAAHDWPAAGERMDEHASTTDRRVARLEALAAAEREKYAPCGCTRQGAARCRDHQRSTPSLSFAAGAVLGLG